MKRFAIIYGAYETGAQKKALSLLSESLLTETKAYPACYRAGESVPEGFCKIYIGTRENNPIFAEEFPVALSHAEEYRIAVKNGTVYIEGFDDNGVLYGIVDFFAKYLTSLSFPNDDRYYVPCFEGDLPNYERISHPAIKSRGLWTWGHVIYDYRGYIDHMVRLKLNTITIWNDQIPVNAREIIDYAHDCGIKVIFGYSWLWDTDCKKIPLDKLCDYSESIFETYEKKYSHLNLDGIYFQSVTEHRAHIIDGIVVAEAITNFVNHTAALFFEKHPHLELQFGLHATSVKKNLTYLEKTDPRIRIVWEDVGAFPFSYMPCDVDNFEETKALTERIAHLRGENDRFGVVTKGLTKLDWYAFEHPDFPLNIGVSTRELKDDRILRKKKIWRYLEAYWLVNADKALEMVALMNRLKKGDLVVSALVEDGMFEENILYPVALFAEMLWDTDADIRELMSKVALRSDVSFA